MRNVRIIAVDISKELHEKRGQVDSIDQSMGCQMTRLELMTRCVCVKLVIQSTQFRAFVYYYQHYCS